MLETTQISPDQVVFWSWGWFQVNATLLGSWIVMAILILIAWLVAARLSHESPSKLQLALEVVISYVRDQIREIVGRDPGRYVPFIGTLFLFIAVANLLLIVPGFVAPTASLSTTVALAIAVFVAVPVYGIAEQGVGGYLKHYIRPTVFMLPFHVIGELSRTLALAVRLFGNIMSGVKIAGLLLAIAPLIFPVILQALGLLTGFIQAYIFAVLAMIYIGSAVRASSDAEETE